MMQYHKYQDHVETVRHPKYTDIDRGGFRQPYFDKTFAYYQADVNVEKAQMRTGNIDNWYTTGFTDFEDLLATNPELIVSVIPQDPNVNTIMAIQWKNPVWGASEAGLKMRRALSMSIDRRKLNDLVYGGAGVPSVATPYDFRGLKAPNHWDELGPYYQPNIPEAKRLMAEAGYPNGYDCEMITTAAIASGPIYVPVQQMLAEAGFRLTFKEVESTVATNLRNEKNFKDFIPVARTQAMTWR
jgi:peptide/nickel transport system substrate-binding protein